ncbi:hypothetical protein MOTT12_05087 [Mycobacterium intracellulare subsp. yongonense]|nr:hypothetical protein MOTT12_05087 [Mycobacterium intracellulare subsp. yongonense]
MPARERLENIIRVRVGRLLPVLSTTIPLPDHKNGNQDEEAQRD